MHPLPDPAAIRRSLADVNLSTTDIARAAGVTRQAIDAVVRGKTPNIRIRRLLAAHVRNTYEELWGEPDPAVVDGVDPKAVGGNVKGCGIPW